MSKIFIVALPEEVNYALDILNYPIIFSGVGKTNNCQTFPRSWIGFRRHTQIASND